MEYVGFAVGTINVIIDCPIEILYGQYKQEVRREGSC